jgi:hypothetical protein
VTLNITSLAHTRIYQSGDFRLTDPRTGKELNVQLTMADYTRAPVFWRSRS